MFVSNVSGAAQNNGLSMAFDLPTLVTRDHDQMCGNGWDRGNGHA
jgi:hypothetical protein